MTRGRVVLFSCIALSGIAPLLAQTVTDPALRVETVVQGLSAPTAMTFIGTGGDFLVAQKDGRVLHFGGSFPNGTVLDVPVNSAGERGLLGMAADPSFDLFNSQFVYLYYTESSTGADTSDPAATLGNRVYRYTLNTAPTPTLSAPRLILDLPAAPGPDHHGGVLAFGPDDALYVVVGDLDRNGKLQNNSLGGDPDDTGVVFRVDTSGNALHDNPFYTPADPSNPMNRYIAYGVRDSTGLAFDPVTGDLWDTESGAGAYDEVNRVVRGFNSGARTIAGPQARHPLADGDLWTSPGSIYRDPEFSWALPVGPSAAAFALSPKLGCDLRHDLLVGDRSCGQIYRLEPNASRDGLSLSSAPLLDHVADNVGLVCSDEMNEILFGAGFGVISDLKNGPDGRLYVVSLTQGSIYRIGPNPGAFPDADGDGVNDACDCAPADRTAFSTPGEVPRLRIGATPALTQLAWDFLNPVSGNMRYTLVSGDLSALRYDGAIARACAVGTNLILPSKTDLRLDPPPGYGYFYLVRGGDSCGPGTYGDGSALDATTVFPTCDLCSGRAGGAMITFGFAGPETLRVWITNGPFIDMAKEFLATGRTQIPYFYPLLDGGDCDSHWTWHPDPATPTWGEFAVEVCDGHPSDVESDKPYWFGIGFCPWSATVLAVEDDR